MPLLREPQPGDHSGPPVVLASGSRYRRELLLRLLPEFEVMAPDVDESPLPGEPGADLARRLAALKCQRVARLRPAAIVIGSDQVAECGGRVLGKPGSAEKAVAQLIACAGQMLTLHTAATVTGPHDAPAMTHLDQTRLRFQRLTAEEIHRYVTRDQPFDCAGSFRFESLGIALFTAVETRDPTAIQGLPLLWLAQALVARGVSVL